MEISLVWWILVFILSTSAWGKRIITMSTDEWIQQKTYEINKCVSLSL